MSEKRLAEHLQMVWSNWHSRTNHCKNCPHWGTGGGTNPFYGVGDLSGDFPTIAFVARDPGPGGEADIPELADRENLGLTSDEIERLEAHIESEYSQSFEDHRHTDIMETGMCNGEYTRTGSPHSPQMKKCAEAFIYDERFEFNIYYTNLKKCREFDGDETGTGDAISHCQHYLEGELTELDPDVIVTLGNEATSSIYDLLLPEKIKDSLGIHPDVLTDNPSEAKNVSYEALRLRKAPNDTAIIPSIHFSNFGRNLNRWVKPRNDHIPDDMTTDEYWNRLVDLSVEFLQSNRFEM